LLACAPVSASGRQCVISAVGGLVAQFDKVSPCSAASVCGPAPLKHQHWARFRRQYSCHYFGLLKSQRGESHAPRSTKRQRLGQTNVSSSAMCAVQNAGRIARPVTASHFSASPRRSGFYGQAETGPAVPPKCVAAVSAACSEGREIHIAIGNTSIGRTRL